MMRTLLLLLLLPSLAGSLTIYRIGGEDLPLPDAAELEDVALVRLSWADFAEGFGGGMDNLDTTDGRIAPLLVSPQDNLSLKALERGGGAFFTKTDYVEIRQDFIDWSVDGDPATGVVAAALSSLRLDAQYIVRLGGRFPVNRVRFYPVIPEGIMKTFQLLAYSPDPTHPSGYAWETVALVEPGQENIWPMVEIEFPTRVVEWFRMRIDNWRSGQGYVPSHPWEIAEFEVYGEGYVPEANYTSQVFDLQAPGSLARVRWSGFRQGRARVTLRTRSGSDEDPNRYWRFTGRGEEKSFRNDDGQPLTLADYNNLQGGKGGITTDLDHWSNWFGFALEKGASTVLSLPPLGQFLQLDVNFVPSGLDGAAVDFIEFWVSQPQAAGRPVAEIWPLQVKPGEVASFVYAMRSTLGPLESGFDRLVLRTPGEFVEIDSVHIGDLRARTEVVVETHRAVIDLPRLQGQADSNRPVEVFFKARVFRMGTEFTGELFDSDRPLELELGLGQPVEEGDATFRLDGNQVSVDIALRSDVLHSVGVRPTALTPNGDGVNDVAHIEYTLLKLAEAGDVKVDIFDLAGRRVRALFRGRDSSGQYAQPWDGLRDDGQMVVPGMYFYRVRVDTDADAEQRSGLISVAW